MDDNGELPMKCGEEPERAQGSRAVLRALASYAVHRREADSRQRGELRSQSAESCKSTRCDLSEEGGNDESCFASEINNDKYDRAQFYASRYAY